MSVKLRWKTYPSGTRSAYLDIYQPHKKREIRFIGNKVKKGEPIKKAKEKAEAIRSKFSEELNNRKYGLVSEVKLNSDFLDYFQNFVDNYQQAGVN